MSCVGRKFLLGLSTLAITRTETHGARTVEADQDFIMIPTILISLGILFFGWALYVFVRYAFALFILAYLIEAARRAPPRTDSD